MSWNINAVKTKIEKDNVLSLFSKFDVSINEIKTQCQVSVAGYLSIMSRDGAHPHRDRTCVLVKDHLWPYVTEMGVSVPGQVWFKLKCVPDTLFGFCYIPPPDSPYFSFVALGRIQEKIKTNSYNRCVLLDDFNARYGNSVRELPVDLGLRDLSYPNIEDLVRIANDNAKALLGMCTDEHLLVLNNLKTC